MDSISQSPSKDGRICDLPGSASPSEDEEGRNIHLWMVRSTFLSTDILEGMIYVPAGLLRDQIEFKPKVEIWAGSRPSWTNRPDCLVESFDDNGTIERISTLLENLDQRT